MSENIAKELANHISDYKEIKNEFNGHLLDSKVLEVKLENYHKRLNGIEDLKLDSKITGFTDKILELTNNVMSLRKNIWIVAIVGGLCGGLVAQIIPEATSLLIKAIFR